MAAEGRGQDLSLGRGGGGGGAVIKSRSVGGAGAVGVYVPGGTAVLPSSALMLSVPAGLAGCGTIVLATPPRSNGSISPEVPPPPPRGTPRASGRTSPACLCVDSGVT